MTMLPLQVSGSQHARAIRLVILTSALVMASTSASTVMAVAAATKTTAAKRRLDVGVCIVGGRACACGASYKCAHTPRLVLSLSAKNMEKMGGMNINPCPCRSSTCRFAKFSGLIYGE